MILLSQQVKGVGRGHHIGFPTINLHIPEDFVLDEGIYAAWVLIHGKTYKGALHFGSVPTFNIPHNTLEVHLIDVTDDTAPDTEGVPIEIDIVEKIRDIKKFIDADELAFHIDQDIKRTLSILG